MEATTLFERLRRDHEDLRHLLGALRAASTGPGRTQTLGRLARAVRVHDEAEHVSLYSALFAHDRGQELASRATEMHRGVDWVLNELTATSPDTIAYRVAVDELAGRLEAHLEWEEERLFPAARFLFGERTLSEIARLYADSKRAQRPAA